MPHFSILRFVQTFAPVFVGGDAQKKLREDLHECCRCAQRTFSVLQTPGGFLQLYLNMADFSRGERTDSEDFNAVISKAEQFAYTSLLTKEIQSAISSVCRHLTLGIDVRHRDDSCRTHAELVGVYDCSNRQFVQWTGKSYPLQEQTATLMYCLKLKSHFVSLAGTNVMVLGCHDINAFSPRSRGSSEKKKAFHTDATFKSKVMSQFDSLVDRRQPSVVLHHPHSTDKAGIWRQGWAGVNQHILSCDTYSSGICFRNRRFAGKNPASEPPRGNLAKVLQATKRGDVVDWIQPRPRVVIE